MSIAPPINVIPQPSEGIFGRAISAGAGLSVLLTSAQIRAIADLSDYVPYTGATGAVNLGTNTLTVGAVTASGLATITQGAANTGVLASTGYSLTGSNATSMVDLAGTWNTTGTPTAIKLNVTNTASDPLSSLMDLQTDGVSNFNLEVGGKLKIVQLKIVSTSDVPTLDIYPFATQTQNQQIWRSTAGAVTSFADAAGRFVLGNSSFTVSSTYHSTMWHNGSYGWASAAVNSTSAIDTGFVRDGSAGTIAARVGTTAHVVNVYKTYTSSTNKEYIQVGYNATAATYDLASKVGSAGGSNQPIRLGHYAADGTTFSGLSVGTAGQIGIGIVPYVNSSLHVFSNHARALLFQSTITGSTSSDGTYLGLENGAFRIINQEAAEFYLYTDSNVFLKARVGGNITFAEGRTSPLLQLGGTTSSFPAIKRNAAAINLRLADDSADAALTCAAITASGTIRHTEVTSTPSSTTQTITLNDGNHQTLNLSSSTGNVTATFTVPTSSTAGTLIISQHGTTSRDITWAVSAGSIKWLGTEPTWNSDATSSVRVVSWRYNGSILYLAATEVAV